MKLSVASVLALASVAAAHEGIFFPQRRAVDSSALEQSLESEKLIAHAHKLIEFAALSNNTRSFGTKGHNATVDYIIEQLETTGYYDVQRQTFPHLFTQESGLFKVDEVEYQTGTFTYSPAGDVVEEIALTSNDGCSRADYPASVAGKIALIKRGNCNYGLKVAHAGSAGALAAIIYNNVPGAPARGTLGVPPRPEGPYVTTIGIPLVDGERLVQQITDGAVVVGRIHAEVYEEIRYSSNVIAQTKTGDQTNIVAAGAHTDSVPAGPGLNDNGSGTLALLEIALQLPKHFPNHTNAISFMWWTAEEVGKIGSYHYLDGISEPDRQNIALYLNFDMIASPNTAFMILDGDKSHFNATVIPEGSELLEDLFEGYFESKGIRFIPLEFNGRGDYDPFLVHGIPAGGFDTGMDEIKTEEQIAWWGGTAGIQYDPCYHQACDTVENLNITTWMTSARATAFSIAHYATTLEGITRPRPAANATALMRRVEDNRQANVGGCGHKQHALSEA